MVGNALLTNLGNTTGKMIELPTAWDMDNEIHDAWAVDERQPQGLHFTRKVAPSFDGRISWFAFEEAIEDWLDITTVAPDKSAPSLKARLVGDAVMYKKPFLCGDILEIHMMEWSTSA